MTISAENMFCSQLQHSWVSCINILDTLLWSRNKHRLCRGMSGTQLLQAGIKPWHVCICWCNLLKCPLFFPVSSLFVFAAQRFYDATLVWKGCFHCLVVAFPKLIILWAFYMSVIVKELMYGSCICKSSTLACVVHSKDCEMVTSFTFNLELSKQTHWLSSALWGRASNDIVSVTHFFPLICFANRKCAHGIQD